LDHYSYSGNQLAMSSQFLLNEGSQWLLVDSFFGEQRVRAEPSEAIELEMALLWST
jgi:hypothetical protein